MDGNMSQEQAKILSAIEDGSLSKDSIQRGLLAIIDTELKQNDHPANMDLINSCCSLLNRMDNPGETYVSNRESSLLQAKFKLNKHYKRQKVFMRATQVAAIFILLFASALFIEQYMPRTTYIARMTVDGQQYQIQGRVNRTEIISTGVAEDSRFNIVSERLTLREAIEYLNFDPQIPSWLPEGWTMIDFDASISPFSSQLSITYSNPIKEVTTKLDMIKYDDPEIAITNYEQSGSGTAYKWNGKDIYVTKNINNTIAVWIQDDIYYSIASPLEIDEVRGIVNSIGE